MFALIVSVIVPAAGIASEPQNALVPADLMAAAQSSPERVFDVIVQSSASSATAAIEVRRGKGTIKRRFGSVDGVAAKVSGAELVRLAKHPQISAITADARLALTSYESAEMWRSSTGAAKLYNGPQTPTIAIIDSGIDPTRVFDFGTRVIARVNFSSTTPAAIGDQLGHGTMVAGLAAGAGGIDGRYKGAAPTSPLVDVRVTDGQGMALTSDVIAAIDWVIANKSTYGIRVANFSLVGNTEASILVDPLNKAVEKLWLSGVVVVAAAGNNGSPTEPTRIGAPANDPFVITVGASDIESSVWQPDDVRAPWSAYGHTADGFAKPDLAAPGRYMIGPVPTASVLLATKPERAMAAGYMWMSGTSFSAPVVSGVAAQLLARRPSWTPDQVKGALMLTTTYVPSQGLSMGVGEINASAAAAVTNPPNPNENLYDFVSSNEFDAQEWAAEVSVTSNWTQANWTASNWTSANWTASNWTVSNWTQSNWVSSNWTASNWTQSNWTVSLWEE